MLRDCSYWTFKKNSLGLIELDIINIVNKKFVFGGVSSCSNTESIRDNPRKNTLTGLYFISFRT